MKKWMFILPCFLVNWIVGFDGLELVLKEKKKQ